MNCEDWVRYQRLLWEDANWKEGFTCNENMGNDKTTQRHFNL